MTALSPEADVSSADRRVEHCMGTVFSIDIRDSGDWRDAIRDVVGWLHRVDAIFSTYRPDSELSRLRRGQLAVRDADPLMTEVLELCGHVHLATDGYFSAMYDGALDPTGLVKGWAIERASGLLRERGSANHAIGGGGDVQLAGEAHPGQPWRLGVSDPFDRSRVRAVVTGRDLAIATSGTAERGEHIVNPFTGLPPVDVASVTVVGALLTQVDCYATAAFAMGGDAAMGWVNAMDGYEALLVTPSGEQLASAGFSRLATSAGPAG